MRYSILLILSLSRQLATSKYHFGFLITFFFPLWLSQNESPEAKKEEGAEVSAPAETKESTEASKEEAAAAPAEATTQEAGEESRQTDDQKVEYSATGQITTCRL